ncbi:MAG: zinc-dependent alcohol dehydrogenase family protein [Oscillospiraceae bacterium]|nr:zinc-dependent alcohol dehydrogenase family protein [Oscillospiraceae bacterium]
MLALVLTAPQTLELKQLPCPQPAPEEVLIKVAACGVCGTDLHLFNGEGGAFASHYPLIMGHEFAGTISQVGQAVQQLQPGDRVCVDPNLYCGGCEPCRQGAVQFCEHMTGYGTTAPGGFAEYCCVNQRSVYKIPDQLSLDHAALAEPVACCLHGLDRSALKPGNSVLLTGFGPIGNILFQLARQAGAGKLAVIEPLAEKREQARRLGADLVVDPFTQDPAAALAAFGPLNTVIDCVGKPGTMAQAVTLASRGATVMLFGLGTAQDELVLHPYTDIFQKELTLTGSFINPLVTRRVINLLARERIDLEQVITDRISLKNAISVFTDSRFRRRGKILLQPAGAL